MQQLPQALHDQVFTSVQGMSAPVLKSVHVVTYREAKYVTYFGGLCGWLCFSLRAWGGGEGVWSSSRFHVFWVVLLIGGFLGVCWWRLPAVGVSRLLLVRWLVKAAWGNVDEVRVPFGDAGGCALFLESCG